MIFTRDQVALIRQGKMTSTLVDPDASVLTDRVRPLRRRFMRHDEDGNDLGWTTETVEDVAADGERRPLSITILAVSEIKLADLTAGHAKACGYKTVIGLKEVWLVTHPRLEVAQLVYFQLGDVRDRDRYLNWTGRAGGDYTTDPSRAMDSDAPVVPSEHLAVMTEDARARDRARKQNGRKEAEALPLSARLDRIAAAKRARRVDITQEMRVIRQRVERAERQLEQPDDSSLSA